MLELNESNFEKTLKGNKNLVVDFWADWCGPCKIMAPVFESLSKEMKNVKFAKINVDENNHLASEFGVMGIPTFIVFKDGKEVERVVGAAHKTIIKEKIESTI